MLSVQETYEQMDALEGEITLLKAKYQKLARTLPKYVIAIECIKDVKSHAGTHCVKGTIRYWAPYKQTTFPQFRSHRQLDVNKSVAKKMHQRQAEQMLELIKPDLGLKEGHFKFYVDPV